jgi:hypothetical protein
VRGSVHKLGYGLTSRRRHRSWPEVLKREIVAATLATAPRVAEPAWTTARCVKSALKIPRRPDGSPRMRLFIDRCTASASEMHKRRGEGSRSTRHWHHVCWTCTHILLVVAGARFTQITAPAGCVYETGFRRAVEHGHGPTRSAI